MSTGFASSDNLWITTFRPNPQALMRLFCFPYAGGTAAIFRTWADGVPEAVEVCAVTLPGRGTRLKESPFTQMEPLIAALAEGLKPYLDRPFAFFGHSMGALMSFELARYLRRSANGYLPEHLFVSGRWAPEQQHRVLPASDAPGSAFLAEMRRLNGIPDDVLTQPEVLDLLLPTLRADLAVNESYAYRAESPLTCPISVFGGLQDPMVRRSDLVRWQHQTTASFLVRMLPGDHFFLNTAQSLLLAMLTQELRDLLLPIFRRHS